jgi:hypothetical protein
MRRTFGMVWASPISLVALLIALPVLLSRCTIFWNGRALELSGGAVSTVLRVLSFNRAIDAITLGHVILARDLACAARWRAHEMVHVRQFERWGALMPIAYAAASLIAWWRGGDAYWDNAFEVDARCEGH